MKIQIKKQTVVSEVEVAVPFYYKYVNHAHTCYGCINSDLQQVEMTVRHDGTLFMMDTRKLDPWMLDAVIAARAEQDGFELIDEAVFSHHFAMHHRELFYHVFPDARPNI